MVGSTISTICYALTIRANLGLGPLFVAQDGLARTVHISIGAAVMWCGMTLVVIAFMLGTRPRPGTLVLPFLAGATLNTILPVVPVVHGFALRVGVVIVATWLMALGGAMVIRAAVGPAAYDTVMLGLHRVTRRPIAPIRLTMEASVLALGWLLGGAVGLGTVLTGLLIGPAMQFWLGLLTVPGVQRSQRDQTGARGVSRLLRHGQLARGRRDYDERGPGILRVIDGQTPLGVETDRDVAERKELLRTIGYKL